MLMATEPATADPESERLDPGRLDNLLNDLRAHWTAASAQELRITVAGDYAERTSQ
jgi:hypothetical protein